MAVHLRARVPVGATSRRYASAIGIRDLSPLWRAVLRSLSMNRGFLKAGHLPTLVAAFLYFDLSFMVWVMLGPLGVQIARDLQLGPAEKGLLVATPVMAGAVLRIVNGVLVDHLKPKLTGAIAQLVVIAGLVAAWFFGVHSFAQVLLVGVVLGLAGASFAIALPLASRWYPPERRALVLGRIPARGERQGDREGSAGKAEDDADEQHLGETVNAEEPRSDEPGNNDELRDRTGQLRLQMIHQHAVDDTQHRAGHHRRGDQEALLGRSQLEIPGDLHAEGPEHDPDHEAQVEIEKGRDQCRQMTCLEKTSVHAETPQNGAPQWREIANADRARVTS